MLQLTTRSLTQISSLTPTPTESSVSLSKPIEGSFVDMIDKALENEFKENDWNKGTVGNKCIRVDLTQFMLGWKSVKEKARRPEENPLKKE